MTKFYQNQLTTRQQSALIMTVILMAMLVIAVMVKDVDDGRMIRW